jgi:DNA-binding CsgD family transcriptional regulator
VERAKDAVAQQLPLDHGPAGVGDRPAQLFIQAARLLAEGAVAELFGERGRVGDVGEENDGGGARIARDERQERTMQASLVVRQQPESGERHLITSDAVMVGRNDDNDIVLNSTKVSRYHARIARVDGEHRVEDLASKNGTWLNGARLDGPKPLKHGDTIRIGDAMLVFEIPGQTTMTEDGQLPDGLTRREGQVLALLAAGQNSEEVAAALVVSARTVERHISNIYAKIGAKNRGEAISYAVARGIR